MNVKTLGVILPVLILAMLLAGCAQPSAPAAPAASPTPSLAASAPAAAARASPSLAPSPSPKPRVVGPGGCNSKAECDEYCIRHSPDCLAWCGVNAGKCVELGVSASAPSGIPGSPCASDNDCVTQLICVDFKCDFPTPENMAKKGGFALPGGCTSMQECAEYCAKPANNLDCLKFCDEFPSFCSEEARGARASEAPAECRACTSCAAKNCILDCVFKCFNYVPFAQEDVAALKRGVVFERRFQSPVKGVWEPGPAYNRIGVTYFVDDYKALGVNAYSVTPKYSHDENKQLIHTIDRAIGGAADNETIGNVIKAKKAGLQVVLVAHDLYDLFPDANSNKGERVRAEDYSTQLEETALKWARVAEEYKAEYFVPVNEFEYVLYENGYSAEEACAATNALYARVIPRVREIFKGKIYCRVGGMDAKFACMNFSQCDVFGFTYGFSGSAYQTNFRALFQAGETAFSRCNKPYFMAESFCLKVRGQTDADCVKLHEAGISEFKATAAHGTGFFFMGLIQNDPINKNSFPIIDTALEDEYKAFFKWMDENKA